MYAANSTAGRYPRNRGVTLIWVAFMLIMLIGFVAMSIDIGRRRLAHTELQNASDAGARAAAWAVPTVDFDLADSRAEGIVEANDADNTAISLNVDQDVQYGIWWSSTRTFETLSNSQLARANAVRVIARRIAARGNALPYFFAPVIGVNSADVEAGGIAKINGGWRAAGHGFGLVGIDWVQMNGTTNTDSYDPRIGAYGGSNIHDYGTIATNGYIRMVGTSDVHGDARTGPEPSDWTNSSFGNNTTVTGWRAPLDADMVFPAPTVPGSNNNNLISSYLNGQNDFGGNGKRTFIIPAGTYVIRNFDLKGNQTLQLNGAVKLYITGSVSLLGNSTTNGGGSNLPADLQIFATGSGDFDLGGGSELRSWVYAPGRDVKYHGTNSGGFYGSVVGKTLDIKGNSELHYDESANPGPSTQYDDFWVEIVK